jgi:type II secretory pathway component PulJ
MKKRQLTICSLNARSTALTLIEVLAAIVILGSVLVGMVLAKSRHTEQLALAKRKQEAAAATDALLNRWWTRKEGVPLGEEGSFENHPDLQWRSRVVKNPAIEKLKGRVVRVTVRDAGAALPGDRKDEPLVTVDLVLPNPKRTPGASKAWAAQRASDAATNRPSSNRRMPASRGRFNREDDSQ